MFWHSFRKDAAMKQITLLILLLSVFNSFAQRNPNTNAGKIKKQPNGQNAPTDSIDNDTARISDDINYSNTRHSVQLGAALCMSFAPKAATQTLGVGYGFAFKLGGNVLKKADIPFNLYAGLGFDYLYLGGDRSFLANNVDIAINSNAYGWYPYLDLEFGRDWPIKPFATAYGGWRFFYTRQNINYLDAAGAKQTDSKNLEGDVSLIYGIGGGLKIAVTKGILLELRYHQNYGNNIKVIDPKTIQFDANGTLKSYQNFNTDSDLNLFFLGITIAF